MLLLLAQYEIVFSAFAKQTFHGESISHETSPHPHDDIFNKKEPLTLANGFFVRKIEKVFSVVLIWT